MNITYVLLFITDNVFTIMPKRSFRSKVNENNKAVAGEVAEGSEALQSCHGPGEMKRLLAEALRENSMRNRTKKDPKYRGNNATLNNLSNSKAENNKSRICKGMVGAENKHTPGKVGLGQQSGAMVYADALRSNPNKVRNSVSNKEDYNKDTTEPIVCVETNNNNTAENRDSERTIASALDYDKMEKQNNNVKQSLNSLLDKLDPGILHELEMDEATWEVISIGDWSSQQSSSDIDEQFHLVTDDEDSTEQHKADSGSDALSLSTKGSEEPKKDEENVATVVKKKKVVVTRKYIGGINLEQKLLSLGFGEVNNGNLEHQKERKVSE